MSQAEAGAAIAIGGELVEHSAPCRPCPRGLHHGNATRHHSLKVVTRSNRPGDREDLEARRPGSWPDPPGSSTGRPPWNAGVDSRDIRSPGKPKAGRSPGSPPPSGPLARARIRHGHGIGLRQESGRNESDQPEDTQGDHGDAIRALGVSESCDKNGAGHCGSER
jgi:hypothetical protein